MTSARRVVALVASAVAVCALEAAPASLSARADTWDSVVQFSSVQGQDGWSYQSYLESTNAFVNDLSWNGSRWQGPKATSSGLHYPFQTAERFHPGTVASESLDIQIARSWNAPFSGDFHVSGRIADGNPTTCDTCNGVDVKIWINAKASSPIFSKTYPPIGWEPEAYDLGVIHLSANDLVHLVVMNRGNGFNDATDVRMIIARAGPSH